MDFADLRETQRRAFYSGMPEDELPYCMVLSKEMITQQMEGYRTAARARVLTGKELQEAAAACEYLLRISDGVESYQKEPAVQTFLEAIRAHMARRLGLPPDASYGKIQQKILDDWYFHDAEKDDPELATLAHAAFISYGYME